MIFEFNSVMKYLGNNRKPLSSFVAANVERDQDGSFVSQICMNLSKLLDHVYIMVKYDKFNIFYAATSFFFP